MTDERMAPLELFENQADGGRVREMLVVAAERLKEAEVETWTGPAKDAHTPMRKVQRLTRPGGADRAGDPEVVQG